MNFSEKKEDVLKNSFIKFFSLSNLPISLADQVAFKDFLAKLNKEIYIPSPYLLKKEMQLKVEKYSEFLSEQIENSYLYSFILDCWSYNSRVVVAIFIKILTPELKIESFLLDIQELIN